MMNLQQAKTELQSLGFSFPPEANEAQDCIWGRTEAEPYDVGQHHFTVWFRSVFVATSKNGFYITSDIKGVMRRYRCRNSNDASVGNIFGGGKTLQAAVEEFCHNFTHKIYNNGQSNNPIAVVEA